jgi:HlyD family secretion protein
MKVQVDIDQADVAGLTANEPVTFEVQTYPRQIFHGILRQVRLEPVIAVAQASVVSYTGIVEVDNAGEQLRPGMTAVVTLGGPARAQAVRIPNEALAFRPSTEVLSAIGREIPTVTRAGGRADNSTRIVWKYDRKMFTPITVRTGLTDDQWTELLDGPIHPGDSLVTRAVLERRSRL